MTDPRQHAETVTSKHGHVWRALEGTTGFKSTECTRCGLCLVGVKTPPEKARPCPGELTISVRLDADHALRVADVWPDGDWPDDITPEAVAALMKEFGRYQLRSDWCLEPDYFVSVGRSHEVRVDV